MASEIPTAEGFIAYFQQQQQHDLGGVTPQGLLFFFWTASLGSSYFHLTYSICS